VHPKFDMEFWRKTTVSNRAGASVNIEGQVLCHTPLGIITAEHYRRLAILQGGDLGPNKPTDVCVFGRGEPPQRHLTKVNGLPYRPMGKPWPRDCEGEPLTFFCQFSFADSRDHMGSLPGDVLLVFVRTERGDIFPEPWPISPAEDDALFFEWYSMDLENLSTESHPPLFDFPKCYTVLHRSCDYINQEHATNTIGQLVSDEDLPTNEFYRQTALRSLACWPGMKIGGKPFWNDVSNEALPGRFIASFGGVRHLSLCSYPRFNELETIGVEEALDDSNTFQLPAVNLINFFLHDDGNVTWIAEFE